MPDINRNAPLSRTDWFLIVLSVLLVAFTLLALFLQTGTE